MAAQVQGLEQLALTQGEQAQHTVVDGQLALAFDFAQQPAAIAARGLQRATGNCTGQGGGAQR